ncbi:MAG TPA: Appr-1-p processing protein [Bacteroidetes bacterium]|nr:Appr-1-p processing protein [Bacteroidota bacterium]
MSIHVGHGEISIVHGDITDQATDALVNAANNHLWMGAGVAGAIKRQGGIRIEQEAMALGPVEVGQAVMTSAGDLKAKQIIHAAVMGQDLHTNAEFVRSATRNSLLLAEQQKLTSISFPALGTGVGGFSLHHCASIMIGESIESLLQAKSLREVRFVLFDDDAAEIFRAELNHRFSAKR